MTKTLQKKLDALPKSPGVYLFYGKGKKLLYIGKAASLHSRVRSYFQKSAQHSPAKTMMVQEITTFDIKQVDTEIEALLLEANLIKKYQPPYNVVMRDDKSYAYVEITNDEFPTIKVVRQLGKQGRYFGPFTDMRALREALKVLSRIFRWRPEKCKPHQGRPCFDYQIGLCPGTCLGTVDKKEYAKRIRKVIWFFEGKKGKVITEIKKELRTAKKHNNDERMRELEFQLHSLEQVLSHSHMVSVIEKYETDAKELSRIVKAGKPLTRIEGYDISNIYGNEAVGSMVVFREGESDKKEYRKFKMKVEGKPNDFAMMTEMLDRRFNRYAEESTKDIWPVPDLVIIDGGKGQLNICTRILKKYNLDIPHISIAKRDEEIFFPGEKNALKLPKASPALHLVQRVRDEAHRFAITYHRKVRSKRTFRP